MESGCLLFLINQIVTARGQVLRLNSIVYLLGVAGRAFFALGILYYLLTLPLLLLLLLRYWRARMTPLPSSFFICSFIPALTTSHVTDTFFVSVSMGTAGISLAEFTTGRFFKNGRIDLSTDEPPVKLNGIIFMSPLALIFSPLSKVEHTN